MSRYKAVAWYSALAAAAAFAGLAERSTAGETTTVLVVPARKTVVQLGFDVARLRRLVLIAFAEGAKSGDVAVHAWSPESAQWIPTSPAAIKASRLAGPEGRAVLVTAGNEPEDVLADALRGFGAVTAVPTLKAAEIVNALDESLHFKPREWRWLADRHGFSIEDLNAERRRYGRYGPPHKAARPDAAEDLMDTRHPPAPPPPPVEDAPEALDLDRPPPAPGSAPAAVTPRMPARARPETAPADRVVAPAETARPKAAKPAEDK